MLTLTITNAEWVIDQITVTAMGRNLLCVSSAAGSHSAMPWLTTQYNKGGIPEWIRIGGTAYSKKQALDETHMLIASERVKYCNCHTLHAFGISLQQHRGRCDAQDVDFEICC